MNDLLTSSQIYNRASISNCLKFLTQAEANQRQTFLQFCPATRCYSTLGYLSNPKSICISFIKAYALHLQRVAVRFTPTKLLLNCYRLNTIKSNEEVFRASHMSSINHPHTREFSDRNIVDILLIIIYCTETE